MPVAFVNGDLLKAKEEILVHQVNCRGVMGGGLAKTIRTRYPVVYDAYRQLLKEKGRGKKVLGEVCYALVDDEEFPNRRVANVFGQNRYRTLFSFKKRFTDYDALEKGLLDVHDVAKKEGLSVAIPYGMGCVIGGGDWSKVVKIIDRIFSRSDVQCTVYRLMGK